VQAVDFKAGQNFGDAQHMWDNPRTEPSEETFLATVSSAPAPHLSSGFS